MSSLKHDCIPATEFKFLNIAPGNTVHGRYIGHRDTKNASSSTMHYFMKTGTQINGDWAEAPGVCVYGCSDLDVQMMQVPWGAQVTLRRLESQTVEGPGKAAVTIKRFEVSWTHEDFGYID
jgi:hypothetical protein